MKVKLIAYTPNPEKVVAFAGKMCYSSLNAEYLWDSITDDEAAKFIHRLSGMGHTSPFEHATFTFSIEGVSRVLLAQITRHRIASFSVRSQRYVDHQNPDYFVPEAFFESDALNEQYRVAVSQSYAAYNNLREALNKVYLSEIEASGMSHKDALRRADKMAMENARYVLPNAVNTQMVVTMNARELLHFFSERCCNRAQKEIRDLADEMLSQCKEVAPNLFAKAGASCTYGACKEGKMSCGNPRR